MSIAGCRQILILLAGQSHHGRRDHSFANILPRRLQPARSCAYCHSVPRYLVDASAQVSFDIYWRRNGAFPDAASYERILVSGSVRFPDELDLPSLLQDRIPRPRLLPTDVDAWRCQRDVCVCRVLPRTRETICRCIVGTDLQRPGGNEGMHAIHARRRFDWSGWWVYSARCSRRCKSRSRKEAGARTQGFGSKATCGDVYTGLVSTTQPNQWPDYKHTTAV